MNAIAPAVLYGHTLGQLRAAEAYQNPDLTDPALLKVRAKMIADARAELAANRPAAPEQIADPRASVLAGLAPRNADDVALHSNERRKMADLMGAGRGLSQIVQGADAQRLAALLDDVEVHPEVLQSGNPAVAAENYRREIFDRLVSIEHEPAVAAAKVIADHEVQDAWSAALDEVGRGPISGLTRTRLYNADRDGYESIREVAEPDWRTIAQAEQFGQAEADQA